MIFMESMIVAREESLLETKTLGIMRDFQEEVGYKEPFAGDAAEQEVAAWQDLYEIKRKKCDEKYTNNVEFESFDIGKDVREESKKQQRGPPREKKEAQEKPVRPQKEEKKAAKKKEEPASPRWFFEACDGDSDASQESGHKGGVMAKE